MPDPMTTPNETPTEGWCLLPNSTRYHYFTSDRRSLCGKWASLVGQLTPDDGSASDEDCASCARKMAKRREVPA